MLRIVGRTILIVIVAALIVGSVFVGIAGALSKSGGLVCHDSVGVNYFGISFPTRFVLYRSDPEIFPGKLSSFTGMSTISCRWLKSVGPSTVHSYNSLGYCYGTGYLLWQIHLPAWGERVVFACLGRNETHDRSLFRPVAGDDPFLDMLLEFEKQLPSR